MNRSCGWCVIFMRVSRLFLWFYAVEPKLESYKLFMRTTNDSRPDTIVKREIFEEHVKPHYNAEYIIDDRPSVCQMWRDLGLTVLQVELVSESCSACLIRLSIWLIIFMILREKLKIKIGYLLTRLNLPGRRCISLRAHVVLPLPGNPMVISMVLIVRISRGRRWRWP